jgi:hypothetical protein
MKFFQKKSQIINCFFFIFVIALLVNLIIDVLHGFPIDSFGITEFLINYEGGFVRRGLTGQLLLFANQLTNISPYYFIIVICLVSYLSLCVFFIKFFIKKGYPLFILPFAFFLGSPVMNHFWVRKDSLVLCLFAAVIYLIKRRSLIAFFAANLILISGLLIHEALGFFTLPVVVLLLSSQLRKFSFQKMRIPSILTSFLILSPSILTFFLVLFFKGDNLIAQTIWDSWENVHFPYGTYHSGELPASIRGIAMSLTQGIIMSLVNVYNFNDDVYAPLAWLFILPVLYFILTNTNRLAFNIFSYIPHKMIDRNFLGNILIVQFVSILPLFILGCDYGRWIYFWVISSFSIMIFFEDSKEWILFPDIISRLRQNVDRMISLWMPSSSSVLILSLIIAVPPASWSLHLYIQSSSIYFQLSSLSKLIKLILM